VLGRESVGAAQVTSTGRKLPAPEGVGKEPTAAVRLGQLDAQSRGCESTSATPRTLRRVNSCFTLDQ
jgi:hypothetical protein